MVKLPRTASTILFYKIWGAERGNECGDRPLGGARSQRAPRRATGGARRQFPTPARPPSPVPPLSPDGMVRGELQMAETRLYDVGRSAAKVAIFLFGEVLNVITH